MARPPWRASGREAAVVRLGFSVELNYLVGPQGADFIFNVQAAHTRQQRVLQESLTISQPVPVQKHTDPATRTRFLRLHADPGPLRLHSQAVVALTHHVADPALLPEVPVSHLPINVLPYLNPSRYCESDRLQALALAEFGALRPGYMRVIAIRDWVHRRIKFQPGASDSSTSAVNTLANGAGVCRDFAHVMIALCRALNLPARFATGFDFGADPALGPQDFHAYVEVYVGGRWFLFDPSGTAIPMAFVRLASSRDAGGAAFGTIFGAVTCEAPKVAIQAMPDEQGQLVEPAHTSAALSTDSGEA